MKKNLKWSRIISVCIYIGVKSRWTVAHVLLHRHNFPRLVLSCQFDIGHRSNVVRRASEESGRRRGGRGGSDQGEWALWLKYLWGGEDYTYPVNRMFQEAEQAAKDREVRRQAHEERVAERAERARHVTQHPKSPSDFSCQSYDNMFAGQDRGIGDDHHREKMSLRSASITSHDKHSDTASVDRQNGKTRKVRYHNSSMTMMCQLIDTSRLVMSSS